MGLGPSVLSVIDKSLSYSGLSYPSSPVFVCCECWFCVSDGAWLENGSLWLDSLIVAALRGLHAYCRKRN